MIYEFAVHPKVFGTLTEFKLWSERFGVPTARMIARYPKSWKKLVHQAISEKDPVKRQSLVEKLRRLDPKLLSLSRSPYDASFEWVQNAVNQHAILPFKAIIVSENEAGIPDLLLADEVDEETPQFKVEAGLAVPRVAYEMAKAVSTLLWASKTVKFIDPFFSPSIPKYKNTLRRFLDEAAKGVRLVDVEYHLTDHRNSTHAFFQQECESHLPQVIPTGVRVTFYRWEEMPDNESLHPRYILTDLAGVRFEHGLDEETDGQTVDVELISKSIYRRRWSEYDPSKTAFKLLDTVTVNGQ
jgi:hypothetical protein